MPSEAIAEVAKLLAVVVKPLVTVAQTKADEHRLRRLTSVEVEAENLKMRAANARDIEQLRHQVNKEAVLAKAQQILNEPNAIKALPPEGNRPLPDQDWLFQWAKHAQEVSSEDVQTLWARVLAGEIANAGRFSLRLLQTLSLLRRVDAENFAKFSNYVWRDNSGSYYQLYTKEIDVLLSETQQMDYQFYSDLQNLGLIDTTPFLTITVKVGQTLSVYYCGNSSRFLVLATRRVSKSAC